MELLDIVNDRDEVIGQATRPDVYAKNLSHRIVHALIFNSAGELALQLRSRQSSFCPNHWSTSAGGHVQAGETYQAAAVRETQEELGRSISLTLLGTALYVLPNYPKKFLSIFRGVDKGPFNGDPAEVERAEFFRPDQVNIMLTDGTLIHPELRFILERIDVFKPFSQ